MTTIIYHANCSDGFCAAWLLHKLFPDAAFIPAHYGDDPPHDFIVGNDVIIADFSYPRDTMISMAEAAKSLRVFDHHKTAQADCADLPFCTFDLDKSGARLVWEHFDTTNPLLLVDYTEDRDLWRWELPDSRAINAVIRSYPFTFDAWNELEKRLPLDLDRVIHEGYAILRYRERLIDAHVEKAVPMMVADHTVLACNCSAGEIISEVANKLATLNDPFGAAYQDIGTERIWSLRSVTDFDVSAVAKSQGGGGHQRAAGFKENRTP